MREMREVEWSGEQTASGREGEKKGGKKNGEKLEELMKDKKLQVMSLRELEAAQDLDLSLNPHVDNCVNTPRLPPVALQPNAGLPGWEDEEGEDNPMGGVEKDGPPKKNKKKKEE